MAELNTDDSGKSGKHSKKRAKKSSTKVDMTPMVDLAFLLLPGMRSHIGSQIQAGQVFRSQLSP